MSLPRYKFDPVSQSYELLGSEERAANEYIFDPVTQQYVPLASGIRSLDGGDNEVSAPSGPSLSMMSPGMAEFGVGAQNLGLALSGIPSLTTQVAGAISSGIGNAMMGSQVSPVAQDTAQVSSISPNQEAVAALASLMAQSEQEDAENSLAAVDAAAAVMGADPTVSVSDPAADVGGDVGSTATGGSDSSTTGYGGSDTGAADSGWRRGGPIMMSQGGLSSMKRYADGGMTMSPQYAFAPTMPMMPSMSGILPGMMGQTMPQMNFKKGGIASLPAMAEEVQDAGRRGDTMLAHITPEEAGILQLLGGSGTINPETGLPEYFVKRLRRFFKETPVLKNVYKPISTIGKGIESGIEKIAKDDILGPIAKIASMMNPFTAALYAGLAPEGSSFDTKGAVKAAALQQIGEYAVKAGMQAQGAPGTEGTVGGPSGGGPGAGAQGPYGGTVGTNPNAPPISNPALSPPPYAPQADPYIFGSEASDFSEVATASAPPSSPSALPARVALPGGDGVSNVNPAPGGPPAEIATASSLPPSSYQGMTPEQMATARAAESTASGVGSLAGAVGETALGYGADALKYAAKNPGTTAFVGTQVYSAVEAKKELEQQKEEAEKVVAAQEKHTKEEVAFAQDVLRRYPVEYRRLTEEDVKSQNLAGGGLAGLNAFRAGGRPRFLKGGGDGMSDDIPAMIGNRQKAALSDGEFVVPADVVSHLGNGSSRAGAKKLYAMMDNIRQARTGKKRQAPEVKPDRYMPA
jgi:hypothetical protein